MKELNQHREWKEYNRVKEKEGKKEEDDEEEEEERGRRTWKG